MNSLLFFATTLLAVTLGFAFTGTQSRDYCIRISPDTAGQPVGFELIDTIRGEVWVTTDWTVEAYAAFSPGLTAPHWFKNEPRQGDAAKAIALRSPGCPHDGKFTYQTIYNRTFFHIADITRITGAGLTGGVRVESTVNEHHRLEFEINEVNVIRLEDGASYQGPIDQLPRSPDGQPLAAL
ncbi:hypothetical protein QTO30_13660 [Yoonia sp. GPGPB17]|uniref:hypothetical protein n=1 Tax=Yoonia sp. GPGPB17 TaxID=3026147 RepID=UPI0030BA8089